MIVFLSSKSNENDVNLTEKFYQAKYSYKIFDDEIVKRF